MTTERKQAEEILDKHIPDWEMWSTEKVLDAMIELASLKLAEATKNMYPKAFIIWKDMNTEYLPYGNTYYVKDLDKHFVGIELVFEYWKQNINK